VVDQATGQPDPTGASPIHFTAVFSEPVSGFGDGAGDVTLSGTAGATSAVVGELAPNDGTTYDIAVSGMRRSGTVTAAIPAGAATDAGHNANTASTSSDNTVTWQAPAVPPVAPPAPPPAPAAQAAPAAVPDTLAPSAPMPLRARLVPGTNGFVRVSLELSWPAASDDIGVDHYQLDRNDSPLQRLDGATTTVTIRLRGPATYTLAAHDAAGNTSQPATIKITRRPRSTVRAAIPAWAWQLLRWRAAPTAGRGNRPAAAPTNVPAWYWPWAGWRLNPYGVGS
jgi:hypothetical protein